MDKIHAVYNSRFNYLNEIKISPLSRAYTFSDSVYEVIPFCNSNLIAFESHIDRLEKSCDALNLSINTKKLSVEATYFSNLLAKNIDRIPKNKILNFCEKIHKILEIDKTIFEKNFTK